MAVIADTPMMRQYWSIKKRHAEGLLFYRMGDFYELFFDDAIQASSILNIALTTRGKHLGEDIPMCGVPVHSAESYLHELIRSGQRVVVCEQTEDPEEARKRGSKSVVRRDVVRVITPGTLTEDSLLDSRRNNFLAAWSEIRGKGGFGWLDLSTGEFRVAVCNRPDLGVFAARIAPREMLLPSRIFDDRDIVHRVQEEGAIATPLGAASFDSESAEERLKGVFRVASLEPFGSFSRAELSAMGAIVDYVELTQHGAFALIRAPVRELAGQRMQIDPATQRNLELVETLGGTRTGSLLDTVDRTATGAGARLLASRLAGPSTEREVVDARLDAVECFCGHQALADQLAEWFRKAPDVERAMARLSLGRGGPRDLGALRDSLAVAGEISRSLREELDPRPRLVAEAAETLAGHEEVREELARALQETLPTSVAEGGFIAPGFSEELDEARELRDKSEKLISALQESYRKATGIASLRIRSNNVLGYFIEVREKHTHVLAAPPHDGTFFHRQTIASAGRFSSPDLSELAGRIAGARARAQELEASAFASLRELVLGYRERIDAVATALAEIDVAVAFGRLACVEEWTRPAMSEDLEFSIVGGRHPVVERSLRAGGRERFIANECDLSADREGSAPLWIVTGPNMAGKSTFLRQNALIAILAQAGSFVPAGEARIGLVDRLFSRVGAADDLARGRSTFMVEMVETAAILHQAGERSLVILDEIGRGTATYDGLSIAWAVLEHLRQVNRSRSLFATHFHELTELAERLEGVKNATIRVKEWEGELVFLYEVVPGVANCSYGVQVARLAGLPDSLIGRAEDVLERLESGQADAGGSALSGLPLFDFQENATRRPAGREDEELRRRIASLDPDGMSPREALEAIYALRDAFKD